MPYFDTTYTDGVIAAREKYLLKDKIFRLCELSAEEAFRTLLESGYGGGAETANSVYEYENLIMAEENALDEFIRTYAPSAAEKEFLLSPRDFHNAKALIKAAHLGVDATKLLAPAGLISIPELIACVEKGDFSSVKAFNAYLGGACEDAKALLAEDPSGVKTGVIFEKALYASLANTSRKKSVLKKLLSAKADMTNILISFRAADFSQAQSQYLPGGKLTDKTLEKLFDEDKDRARRAFVSTPYAQFVSVCFEAREKGLPLTEAEKIVGGFDTAYFAERKYGLKRSEPFLYYVYRRRVENANVRIVFACLLAGQSEREVKQRLRAF